MLAQYDVILARQQPGYYKPAVFETYSRNISDLYGHGTHVTSIIASSGVAASGNFQGVAPGVNLVSVRALDGNGTGVYSDVISRNPVGDQPAPALRHSRAQSVAGCSALRSLLAGSAQSGGDGGWASGIVVVTAAGNRGPKPMTINAPGDVPYVITVGAVTDNYSPMLPKQYSLASFSSAGPTFEGFVKPDVVGMGGHILAYAPDNGTLAAEFPQWVQRALP